MKKITVKLTAIVLSAFIFLGGVGGSYIEGYCADSGTRFLDVVWNYDDSVAGNLLQYVGLCLAWSYAAVEPTFLGEATAGAFATAEFLHYMNSDKGVELTEEEIPQYFEDNVQIHGGGGLSFSDDIVDALHYTAQAILDEQSGYWLVPTIRPDDVFFVSGCSSVDNYNAFQESMKNFGSRVVLCTSLGTSNRYSCISLTDNLLAVSVDFPGAQTDLEYSNYLRFITDDWIVREGIRMINSAGSNYLPKIWNCGEVLTLDNCSTEFASIYYCPPKGSFLCTLDGHPVRVWKSLDAFKLFTVGKQPYYCTPEWVNYDYSQDNSMTLTNTYLGNVVNGGVVNNYYNVVQDAINENNTDGSLTEDQIRDIVADTINQIQQNNNTESDSGGSGSDDNGSGSGIIAIIEGIGKFFDTLLTLVGNVIGMIADFGNSVLEMFGSLGTFTEGFSSFLSGTFGFIPEEVWKVLMSGITLSVLLLGIKFFK